MMDNDGAFLPFCETTAANIIFPEEFKPRLEKSR